MVWSARIILGTIILACMLIGTFIFLRFRFHFPIVQNQPWTTTYSSVLAIVLTVSQMLNPNNDDEADSCGIFPVAVMTLIIPLAFVAFVATAVRLLFKYKITEHMIYKHRMNNNTNVQRWHTHTPSGANTAGGVSPRGSGGAGAGDITIDITGNGTGTAPASSINWYLRHVYITRAPFNIKLFGMIIIVGIVLGIVVVMRQGSTTCAFANSWHIVPFFYSLAVGGCTVIASVIVWTKFSRFESDAYGLRAELFSSYMIALVLGVSAVFTLIIYPRQDIWRLIFLGGIACFWMTLMAYPLYLVYRHWKRQETLAKDVQKVVTLEQFLELHPQAGQAFAVFLTHEFSAENILFYNRAKQFASLVMTETRHPDRLMTLNLPAMSPSMGGGTSGAADGSTIRAAAVMALREGYSIFHTFISFNAPYPINISASHRQRIIAQLQMMTTACASAVRTQTLTSTIMGSAPAMAPTFSGANTFSSGGGVNNNTISGMASGASSPRRTISGGNTTTRGGAVTTIAGNGAMAVPGFVAALPASSGAASPRGHTNVTTDAADTLLLAAICSIYDEARAETLKLMSQQSWTRFRASPIFGQMINDMKHHIPVDHHEFAVSSQNNSGHNAAATGGTIVASSPVSPRGGGVVRVSPLATRVSAAAATGALATMMQLNDMDDMPHHHGHGDEHISGGGGGSAVGMGGPSLLLSLQMIHGKSTPDVFHPSVTHTPRGIHMFPQSLPKQSTPTPPLMLPGTSGTTTPPVTTFAWSSSAPNLSSSASPPRATGGQSATSPIAAFSPSSRSNVRSAIFFPPPSVPPILSIPLSSLVTNTTTNAIASGRTQPHHASFSSGGTTTTDVVGHYHHHVSPLRYHRSHASTLSSGAAISGGDDHTSTVERLSTITMPVSSMAPTSLSSPAVPPLPLSLVASSSTTAAASSTMASTTGAAALSSSISPRVTASPRVVPPGVPFETDSSSLHAS